MEWKSILAVPESVRDLANWHRPTLGSLIVKVIQNIDGSFWAIKYSNPGAEPLYCYELPEPPK